MKTLADGLAQRQDNFLLLRFLAASLVIYGHSYAVSSLHMDDIFVRHGLEFSGTIAVDMFFVVSGFLVTGSLIRRNHIAAFLVARASRLLPAYAACLLIWAFVLGPWLTTLSPHDYMRHPDTLAYVSANLGLQNLRWNLPGVFAGNPHPDVVNGSIWTLPAEASMYLWLAALGLLGVFRWRWLAGVVLFGLSAYAFTHWLRIPMLVHNADYARFAGFFVLGSFCYLYREHVPIGHLGMLGLALLAMLTFKTFLFPWTWALGEAYFCFWFAYCVPWYGFNRFGDYSYGIYLWGFPCQQLVASWLGDSTPTEITLCTLPMVIVIAAFSWHFLEKPALRLKNWRIWKTLGLDRSREDAVNLPVDAV